MCDAVRVLAGTLLVCLAVAACAPVEEIPATLPRVFAPPDVGDVDGGDTGGSGVDGSAIDDATVDPQRPDHWPARIVLGFQGATGATVAQRTLAGLIEETLHVEVAIVPLRDVAPGDVDQVFSGLDVVVADAMTAHTARFDGRLHTVRDAATGQATAWVTLAPDVWCPGGTVGVDADDLGRCVGVDVPVVVAADDEPPGGLARLADRIEGREVVVPASSATAMRLAALQFERELGVVPGSLVVSGLDDPADDALWLVPVEPGPGGGMVVGSWGPRDDDRAPVVVAWGPWVPHAVVAVSPGVDSDLAGAIDQTQQSLSGRMD
ncbi:MAG: hypothetical protein WDZ26_00040, partial [Nitriliruptoraceae bacterium]